MMKKMISMICCAVIWMGMSVICTAAYEFPSEFWEQHDLYEPALENKNYPDIIKYGKTSIEILEKEPNCPETRRAKASKYRDVGEAYFYLQDYQSCEPYYKKLQELVEQYPSELSDFQETVNATVKHLSTDMRLYTDGGDPVYYGARNEKKKGGVLYGACYDGNIRKNLENESMLLSYQELGQQLATYNINALDTAQKRGLAVEIALNCPREGKDIRNFDELSDSLQEMYDLLKKYDDVPAIYLRFGAEFNIWSDLAEPDDFIAAFRQVYRQFTKLDNVAVVWSPYQTSSYGINMHDYYPGDAYVDWVGMSSYAEKYFLGSKKQSPYYNLMFQTGLASTPVTAVSEIIDTYGDRKPIMLSESGCSHYVFPEDEDTTDFAVRRMQEYYEYLPMVYPQIKLMAHFDMYVAGGNNDFRVSNNEKLKEEYLKRTKGPRFIQNSFAENPGLQYREMEDNISVESVFPVSCYAHMYGEEIKTVAYYLDGVQVGHSSELPFTVYIDASDCAGRYTLEAIAHTKSGKILRKQIPIRIMGGGRDISVYVSGEKASFDQQPLLINGRTMVPMRKIFEMLDAEVSWDGTTRTVTGRRGDRTVKVTVGGFEMYVNSRKVDLDVSPVIINGRTLVPVRAIAEGLGCDVDWESSSSTVLVEPKVFRWSDWMEELPDDVDEDMYYIEEREVYRYREREYLEVDYKVKDRSWHLDQTKTQYGDWSEWSRNYVEETSSRDVQESVRSEPKRYFYSHYCTGNIEDADNRYKTSSGKFHDSCNYHELGWFDEKLPQSPDYEYSYEYYVNGKKHRCSNSCYRWYLTDETGGEYTVYRWRPVTYTHYYSRWSEWSDYQTRYPRGDEIQVDEKTEYRYKEK